MRERDKEEEWGILSLSLANQILAKQGLFRYVNDPDRLSLTREQNLCLYPV